MATNHKVVPHAEWIEERKKLLAKEKEFTRLRDQLSAQRRELPWERVDKQYAFEGPNGTETLPELFDCASQLVVYHFMFDPNWDAGCPNCSFWADNFNGIVMHLKHRDITLRRNLARAATPSSPPTRSAWAGASNGCRRSAAISIATTMCRSHPTRWRTAAAYYNYEPQRAVRGRDAVGISAFSKDAERERVPHLFDLFARHRHAERRVPLPRSHAQGARRGRPRPCAIWVRRHDEYDR